MNNTTKTAILTLILVSATLMGGCLNDTDTTKETVAVKDLAQLEAILTDPKYSDAEKQAAFTAVGEKYGIKSDVDKTEVGETSEPERPKYTVGYALMESGADLLAGVGHFTVVFTGVSVVDQTTVSGFNNIGLDKLENVEIFVNNESVAEFTPILNERKKIETTQVGDWIIRIEGTFTDGTNMTIREGLKFNGMQDLSDHPEYTGNGQGPFGERYIEPSTGMTREDSSSEYPYFRIHL